MKPRSALRTVSAAAVALAVAAAPTPAAVKNPDTFVQLSDADPQTLDPAWATDTDGQAILLNIYETLFQYDGTSLEKIAPLLAERVPTKENGLLSSDERTYVIPIRKGVRFHDGTPMTAADVRYSLLRYLLQDHAGGQTAQLLEPLVGYSSTRDGRGAIRPGVWEDLARAVSLQGDALVLRLPRPCSYLLAVMASRSPLIVSQAWTAAHGDWDGSEASWKKFNDPKKEDSPLYRRTMGTGPFKLERWDPAAREFVLVRNDGYWRAPARLKTIVIRARPAFLTARMMLEAGDVDSIQTDPTEESQLRGLAGVSLLDTAPDLGSGFVVFFTYRTESVSNRFVGSGRLDGAGVPPELFADKDARQAFAYAFDYDAFLHDVLHGRGVQARGCVPRVLRDYAANGPMYRLDLKKAEEHFRKALGGRLWEKGFAMTIGTTADPARLAAGRILKKNIERLNPKFKIEVRALDWPTFADAYHGSKLPVFISGFSGKYPDAYNFAFSFLHSGALFPKAQQFSSPEIDRLIEKAGAETDLAARRALYARLQTLEFEEVPHIALADVSRFRVQRDWVHGWVDNPIFPNAPYSGYYYPMWKQ